MRIGALTLSRGESGIILGCLLVAACISLWSFVPHGPTLLADLAGAFLLGLLIWDIRLVVPILILALPFGPRFQVSFGSLYLTTVVLMITYVAWFLRMPLASQPFSLRSNSIILWMTVFALVLCVSAIQDIGFLVSHRGSLLRFVQFFLYLGIFPLVMQMRFTRAQIKAMLALVLVAGVFEAFLGLLQWHRRPGFYISGTFDGVHNHFSAHIVFICILLIGVLLKTRKTWIALLCLGGIGLTAYANVFSFSRTGYVSMVISTLAFLLMPIGNLRKGLIAGVTGLALAVVLFLTPLDVLYRVWEIYWTLTGRRVAVSFSQRLTLWGEAFRDFRRNPLLGKGAWAYNLRDNFYVKLAAESGLLGLGAFFGLLYVILKTERRALMHHVDDDFVKGLAIGLFPASIGSLLIFNLAGDFFQVHRFIGIFWLVLALVLRFVWSCDGASNESDQATPQSALR